MHVYDEVLALIEELNDNKSEEEKKSLSQDFVKEKEDNHIYNYDDIISYAKKYVFQVVDNRNKGGVLWVYHDKNSTIHSLQFKDMGMRYKVGRGWWIK